MEHSFVSREISFAEVSASTSLGLRLLYVFCIVKSIPIVGEKRLSFITLACAPGSPASRRRERERGLGLSLGKPKPRAAGRDAGGRSRRLERRRLECGGFEGRHVSP